MARGNGDLDAVAAPVAGLSRARLLIDENLSVQLTAIAHEQGFEAAHVAHMGFQSWKDWTLMEEVARHDWVLVTNNAIEFRGRYARLDLHPGVVFIRPSVRREQQIELFRAALSDIEAEPECVNKALDVDFDGPLVVVRRHPLP